MSRWLRFDVWGPGCRAARRRQAPGQKVQSIVLAAFLLALAGSNVITAAAEGTTPQSISFTTTAPATSYVGDTYTPAATASSGLSVSITVDSSSTGVCSISSGTVTAVNSGICTLDANQSGDSTYLAADQVQEAFDVTDAYSQDVLALDPAAYWPLSDAGGSTAADAGENGDTGTLQSGVAEGVSPGVPGQATVPAMSFDGTSGYVSTPTVFDSPDVYTISAWFKTTSADGGYLIQLADSEAPYDGGWDRQLWIGDDGTLYFGEAGGSSDPGIETVNSPTTVTDGIWHYAVGVSDGSTMKLYLDGVLVASTAFSESQSVNGPWLIGAGYGGWPSTNDSDIYSLNYFEGDMANVAVFSSALTADEVTTLYNAGEYLSGGTCTSATLSSSPDSPQLQGVPVTLAASATCTPGATAQYAYSETPPGSSTPVVLATSTSSTYTWNTGASSTGVYSLGVAAQAMNEESDSTASISYAVSANDYDSAIEAAGPTAFWPLSDSGGGTGDDLSGNGDTGTLVGGVTEDVTPGLPGIPSVPSMSFDGSTGYITSGTQFDNPDVYTISGWFNTTANNGGVILQFAQDQTGADGGYDRELYVGTDGYLYFGECCNVTTLTSPEPVNDGSWHYAVGVSTGSSMELYLDGTLVASTDFGESQDMTGYWRIGGGGLANGWPQVGSAWFDGDLADVAVFPTALSSNQVGALYVGKDPQSVSFTSTAPSNADVGGTYSPSTSATSGLGVSLSIPSSSAAICSESEGTVSFNAIGTCVVDANQAGDGTYTAAPQGSQTILVGGIFALHPSAFWPLSDTGGTTAVDLSGNRNTGGLEGDVSEGVAPGDDGPTTAPVMGFDGSTGYVATTAQSDGPYEYSIAGWFKTTDANGGFIIQFSGVGGWDRQLWVGDDGTLYYADCCNGAILESANAVDDGRWHYVVGVSSSSGIRLYLDGALIGSNSFVENQPIMGSWTIGTGWGGWPSTGSSSTLNFFEGDLADVAVFPAALTSRDVESLYAGGGYAVQTVAFTSSPSPDESVGDTFTPRATASSGLAVTMSIDPSSAGVCSLSGGAVTFDAAGTCTIDANQAGNSSYLVAPQAQQSIVDYTYARSALALGPVEYWPLSDVGTETAVDLSGSGDTGALQGGVEEDDTPGITGETSVPGMTFDGSSGYVETPNQVVMPNVYTVSGWFQTTSSSGGYIVQAGDSQSGASDAYDRQLWVGTDGQLYFGGCGSSSCSYISSGVSVNDGDWHFAVGVQTSSSMLLYLDGSLVASTSAYEDQYIDGWWRIGEGNSSGWSNTGSGYFDGALAQVAVFSSALTADDVAGLYASEGLQVITFTSTAPTEPSVGSTYTPTATSTSGLSVDLTVDSSSSDVCSMASGTVTFNAAGECTIDANQAGDSTYVAASQVQQQILLQGAPYQGFVDSMGSDGFWSLSDTDPPTDGTTAADGSGNGNDGTLYGGVTEDLAPGIPGLSTIPVMGFDGSSGHIVTGLAMDAAVETISGWFNTTTSGVILGEDGNGAVLMVNSSGQVSFEVYNNQRNYATSSASFNDGNWHFVVAELSSSGMVVYVDGAEVATNSNNVWNVSGNADIGFSGAGAVSGDSYFDGELADIAIFPSALDADQVDELYATSGLHQSLSFTSSVPSDATVGGSTYTPTATATSGLDVAFAIATPSVCSLASGAVSFGATGACTIEASQAGDSTYAPAAEIDQTVVVQTTYGSSIVALDPSGYWPLNDTDPPSDGYTAVDASEGGGTGSIQGGVTEDQTPGIPAYSSIPAMAFDRSSGYISTGSPTDANEETVAGWFETASSGVIIGANNNNTVLMVGSSGQVSFELYNGGRNYATSSASYSNGRWHFAVGVVDSSGMTLYVDGAGVATNGNNGWNTGGVAELGYSGAGAVTGDAYFQGDLADIMVFPYALTADQATSLYATENTVQSISFSSDPPTGAAPGESYTPSASATSGLPVSFTSATDDTCTVASGVVSLVADGTCTIDAGQGGDAEYSPASADQSFMIASVTIGASNYGPFSTTNVTLTATATSPVTLTLLGPGGSTLLTCSDTRTCSASVADPMSSGSSGTGQYAATWGSNGSGGQSSVTTNLYWNAVPVVSTSVADDSDGLYINPFSSQPTDQYCVDPDGSPSASCTTASFEATNLDTNQSVSATDTDGTLSGSLVYPAIDGLYGPEDYVLSETADGETGTSASTVVNSPLGYWVGPVAALFFLSDNIPAGSESYTYETVSDSPAGVPYIYSGMDQNNSGTCEATEGEGGVYCGQYASANVQYLQLWTGAGTFLGFTPTAGFSSATALALFLEEIGLGNPSLSSPTLNQCDCADPVNMESGELYESYTDLNVAGLGRNLNVTRSYNSLDAGADGPFGYGWTSNLAMTLAESSDDTVATITDESGSPVVFTLTDGVWTAPDYNSSTLTKSDGAWTYSRWDGDTYDFNSSGQLTSETDRNGNTTTFSYTDGNLSTVTGASGRTLTLTWSGGNITEIEVPDDVTVHYGYTDGNLTSVENPAGGYTHYTYDGQGNLLTIEDPDGDTTTNTYNDADQVLTQTDPAGHETTFSYSSPGSGETATLMTDPRGDETYFLFDDGLLTQETKAYGTSIAATTTYTYDPITLGIASETAPDGDLNTYTYDPSGYVLTKTDPLGNTTYYTYNSLNEPLTVTNAEDVTTTNTYDSDGNLLSTSTPLVTSDGGYRSTQTTTYTYGDSSDPGLPTSMEDPDGDTTTYGYDSHGDLTSSTNAAGDETTYTYDALGRELTVVAPDGNVDGGDPSDYTTTYTYDALGDLLTSTDPDGDETTNTYDGDGRLLTTTDPNGDETVTTYNADGEPTEVQDKDSGGSVLRTTDTAYDDAGNVTSTTDGDGNDTTYTYNALDQKVSSTNALGKTTSYTYDGDGNLLTQTAPDGAVTTDSYDADGNLISTSYSDSTPGVTYSYDAVGQKTSMTDGTGTSSWSYDSLGQETSYVDGAGAAFEYGYDLVGNQTSIAYSGLGTVTQTFNAANEMTSISDWNSDESTFTYDASGDLTAEYLANGVSNAYSYDPAGNLSTIADANGSDSIFSASYSRNANSLITADSSQPTNDDYKYTGLSQVCYSGSSNSASCSSPPSGADAYSYDSAGNLTEDDGTQQEFNDGDEPCWSVPGTSSDGCSTTPSGATSYSYNDDGDLTGITYPTGSSADLSYNAADELDSYGLDGGATTTYAYDGNGLRQSKSTGSSTTEFAWNDSGSLPLLLQESTGSATTSYVYGPTGLPLVEVLSSGATYYYSQDNLGSTRVLTDSGGDVADTDTYDPYGNVTASTGSVQNNLLYCGQYMDTESGFYYLQARYYDPTLGQFLSVDPLVSETGMPYAYTAGDPVNTSDASGLCSWFGCVGAAANAVSQATGVCLRNPFGGNNGNGGCETTLSTKEGETDVGVALGAGAVILSGGALLGGAGVLGLSATATGYVGAAAGLGATALDTRSCLSGDRIACVGAGLGGASSLLGLGPLFGIDSSALLGGSFALGSAGLGWDLGALFGGWSASSVEAYLSALGSAGAFC